MGEGVKKDANYYWERVNGLRFCISKLDSVCKTFQSRGVEGTLRSVMVSGLLHDALCASFTQAAEMFRPHTDDVAKVESIFLTTARQVIKEVLSRAKAQDAEVIAWSDVVGDRDKVYDPYGAGKEGEEDG